MHLKQGVTNRTCLNESHHWYNHIAQWCSFLFMEGTRKLVAPAALKSALRISLLSTGSVPRMFVYQASTLTQNDTGPVGPITPSIYWSCKIFTGPTFFL